MNLKEIIYSKKCDDDVINEENEENYLENYKSSSKSTVNDPDICKLDIAEHKIQEHVKLKLNIFINELIIFTTKKHDDGIKFDQIKQFIIQQINQNTDEKLL